MTEAQYPALVFTARKLLDIAKKAANRSKTEPDQALVAILFSAAAVEGYLNELAAASKMMMADDTQVRLLTELLMEAEEQKVQIAFKLQIVSSVCRGILLDRGDRPYQDFDLLFKIRNLLVHLRPDRSSFDLLGDPERKPHATVDQLVKRGIVRKDDIHDASDWLQVASRAEVALWACETARTIVVLVHSMLPDGTLKNVLARAWSKRKTPFRLLRLNGSDYAHSF
jgi:hypothetical protein